MILFVDLSPTFFSSLRSAIETKGLKCISITTREMLASHVVIDCTKESGFIRMPDGLMIDPFSLNAVLAGPLALEAAIPDVLNEFRYSQATALLGYICSVVPRQLNRPFGGSYYCNCGTLFDQWQRVMEANLSGIRVPKWEVGNLAWPTSVDKLILADPFRVKINVDNELTATPKFGAAIERPLGIIGRYAFCRDTSHLIIDSDGQWAEVTPPTSIKNKINGIVQIFQQSCGIDFGEIHFSYLGDIVFLSIAPTISDEHFHMKGFEEVVEEMATAITS